METTALQGAKQALIRNRGKFLVTAGLVLLAVLGYTSVAKPEFTSEAKLFVTVGRKTVDVAPTAERQPMVDIAVVRANEIQSISELLSSRELLDKTLDEIGDDILDDDSPGIGDAIKGAFSVLDGVNLNPFRVYSERDEAIEDFNKNLEVIFTKRSAVITVSLSANSAESAQKLLETLIENAKREYLRVNNTAGSVEFLDRQKKDMFKELDDLKGLVEAFKNKHNLASLEQQRSLHLSRINELETQLAGVASDLASVQAEVTERIRRSAEIPQMVIVQEVDGQANTAEDGMREKLYELQVEEKRLSSVFSDSPQLRTVRSQIENARKVLDQENSRTQVAKGRNPAREAMEMTLLVQQTRMKALAAK